MSNRSANVRVPSPVGTAITESMEGKQPRWWQFPDWRWWHFFVPIEGTGPYDLYPTVSHLDTSEYKRQVLERDFQRSKLYRSEGEAYSMSGAEESGLHKRLALEEAQGWIMHRLNLCWYLNRFGSRVADKGVTVEYEPRKRAGSASAFSGRGLIKFSRETAPKWLILHEMCHLLTPRSFGSAHGRYFCRVYLEAVRREFGDVVHGNLKDRMRANNVKHAPKRYYTPEVREKMSSRMKAMAAGKEN